MYYKVTLLDDSLDKSTAEIIAYQDKDTVSIQVVSDNLKMKEHLTLLLAKDAYILAPGRNSARLYSDNALHLYPNTIHYFQALPEILSWRGYNAVFVNETHKSMDWYEDEVFMFKSVDTDIYNNAQGERIVKKVPDGYVAVNTDGRTVAAGRWLNANIDKEGADWSLVPNPYEEMDSKQREEEKNYMEMGLQKYHPGAYEDLYGARQEETGDYYQSKEGYAPSDSRTLQEHYAQTEEEIPPQNLPLNIPEGSILYSPEAGYAMASTNWPPSQLQDYQKYDWYVFPDTGLTDEDKEAYAGMMGESPSLLRGLDKGIVKVPEKLDVSEGFQLKLPSLDNMTTIGATPGIVLNPLKLQEFPMDEMTSPEYKTKAKLAQKKLSSIKALTSVRDPETGEMSISPDLDDMTIPDLDGLSATWRANFEGREYQKAGILALVEPTQYEIFGGPKGWHGHFLNYKFGLGKVSPLDEVVYTPNGKSTIGEIAIGDFVMSEQGTPVKVTGYYPHENWQFYKVSFSDDTSVEVGKDHLWDTFTTEERNSHTRERTTRTTATIMESLMVNDEPNHSIQYTAPVQFSQSESLPIDPYIIGAFLGNNRMSAKGLFKDAPSFVKSIPQEYLYASLDNRIALLQGMMDSNGNVVQLISGGVRAEYVTSSSTLAKELRELALGLGGNVSIATRIGSYRQEDGTRAKRPSSYQVQVGFPHEVGFNPFRLARKAKSFSYMTSEEKFIVSVEPTRVCDGACILVDSPTHLYLTRDFIVTHNTAIVTAANAVLRNRGVISSGTQTTIVTAPTKNIYIWQNEVGKFLGEYAVVIDGSRATRIEQWETLIKQAQDGELPNTVIVGSSKFRFSQREDTDEDAWELDIDAQYMKLLAQGGRSGEREVKGGHIGVFAIDESGQYVNYDTAKHRAIKEVIDSVYNTKGLVWTLSGNISGNSATDTLSEASFINAYARSNYITLAQEYTMTDRGSSREHKHMGRRIWKDYNRLRDFMSVFGNTIYPLSGKTVAGDNFGLVRTEDEGSPLGANWGTVYMQAERKLRQSAGLGKMNKALGLTSILINSSFGAASPARLLEYDLGTNILIPSVTKQLMPSDAIKFKQELKTYLAKVTVTKNSLGIGRLPNNEIDINDRNKMFNKIFSQTSRDAMDAVLFSWDSVILDNIVQGIDNEMKNHQGAGQSPVKMGVAGFSKRAINSLYRKLRDRYSEDKVLINLIDGDTPSEDVSEQQTAHQREKDRFVISLVTGAGLYGLSLPSDRSWRFPTWNSAKAGQYEGRFHRKAEQHNVSTVTVPDGIVQYMRELEQRKSEMAREATHILIDANDEADELELKGVGSLTSFMDKLVQYRPRILERESEK